MIPYKMWYKFKGESGEQLSFEFYENSDEWVGPFWNYSNLDSENLLLELYNTDAKRNRDFKITGKFNGS